MYIMYLTAKNYGVFLLPSYKDTSIWDLLLDAKQAPGGPAIGQARGITPGAITRPSTSLQHPMVLCVRTAC